MLHFLHRLNKYSKKLQKSSSAQMLSANVFHCKVCISCSVVHMCFCISFRMNIKKDCLTSCCSCFVSGGNLTGAIFNPALAFSLHPHCFYDRFLTYSLVYWIAPCLGKFIILHVFKKVLLSMWLKRVLKRRRGNVKVILSLKKLKTDKLLSIQFLSYFVCKRMIKLKINHIRAICYLNYHHQMSNLFHLHPVKALHFPLYVFLPVTVRNNLFLVQE